MITKDPVHHVSPLTAAAIVAERNRRKELHAAVLANVWSLFCVSDYVYDKVHVKQVYDQVASSLALKHQSYEFKRLVLRLVLENSAVSLVKWNGQPCFKGLRSA